METDLDIVKNLIKINPIVVKYLSVKFKNRSDIIELALSLDCSLYKDLSNMDFKISSFETIKKLILDFPSAISHASLSITHSVDKLVELIALNNSVFEFIGEEMKFNGKFKYACESIGFYYMEDEYGDIERISGIKNISTDDYFN